MTIDQAEIDRVDAIHAAADHYAKVIASNDRRLEMSSKFQLAPGVMWSREEVRAWLDTVAKMRARLAGTDNAGQRLGGRLSAMVAAIPSNGFEGGVLAVSDASIGDEAREKIARGLCLYRESRAFRFAAPFTGGGCDRCGCRITTGCLCHDCNVLLENEFGPATTEAKQPDPYALHRARVERKLQFAGRLGNKPQDELVAASMATEDAARDAWKPGTPSPAERLAAGLKSERVAGRKKPSKHDARPGIDDTGGFSSPTWEE